MDMSEDFKMMAAAREKNFAIKLDTEQSCGMDLITISVTSNGHQWRSLSLTHSETAKLMEELTRFTNNLI